MAPANNAVPALPRGQGSGGTAQAADFKLIGAVLPRQGLELTVAGPYHELARYVQTLERAMPALRWGTMRLSGDRQTSELTLQVWLIGSAP